MILNIDVVSDVICPWCFVGKRRIEQAIQSTGDRYEFRIAWHPFQLNPGIAQNGIERRIYRTAKFGSWEHSQVLDARLSEVGKTVGIEFAFDRMQWMPNTFDAHRLIWLAQQHGLQETVVEAIFQSYFVKGENIGDRQILTQVAIASGIHSEQVNQLFDRDEGISAVQEEEAAARRLGISGVPYIIINGKYSISGAQDSETLTVAFQQANELAQLERQESLTQR
jgi:predicted DsbA family dithiol-disulfide isomerase